MRPRTAIHHTTFLACLTAITGCSLVTRIVNPAPEIKEVSLVPVSAGSLERTTQWTNSLRNNLLRVGGVERVVVTPYLEEQGQSVAIANLPMARSSQALFELTLLAFDPHYPPSASVEVNFYVPGGTDPDADSGLHMDRLGSAPGTEDPATARHRLTFQLPFRAEDPQTAIQVKLYALAQMDDDRGFGSVDRILRSSERFIDFVAFQAIKESFARLEQVRASN